MRLKFKCNLTELTTRNTSPSFAISGTEIYAYTGIPHALGPKCVVVFSVYSNECFTCVSVEHGGSSHNPFFLPPSFHCVSV